ncbi:alpha/beta-hydrolase [Dendrothele bispora CBS 962.96]|uniref:Carboxylic ester hydrolase n=1 Tax=Dendrothele bispora (strain CBS 962.96) TaxID=1314807 RepID=A0A4S8MSN7_DENBC|nr:alpha/beta-hydrolase [Dendrothele bispora CBS 962.96]
MGRGADLLDKTLHKAMVYFLSPRKLLLSTLTLPVLYSHAQSPSVTLEYGTFTGSDDPSTGITSFLGIRFADPPTGNLRWRAAVSPPSSNVGTVNATQFAPICASIGQTGDGTSEDCLFGNVFVPSGTTSDDSLPVMVWFHGGGFQNGGTRDFDPRLIMQSSKNPMIFVSFAYRLGALGFLGGARLKADGQLNAGMQDQRAGLAWLQRYISQFGGDPSRVTIWGESAGAGSTMFHLLANGGDAGGLFHAAMGDSPSLSFTPAFDGDYIEGIFNFFSSSAGQFAKVPVLFGSNTNEGAGWSAGLPNPAANTANPNATQETVFNFLQGQWNSFTQDSFNRGLELYPLDDFSGSFDLQGQQMYGEARYICTAGLITAGLTSAGTKAFQYHYDNPHLGSNHGNDLQAFFPATPANADGNDLALFEAMREFFTSFVTTGTPTSGSAGVNWEAVTDTSNDGNPRILLHPGGIAMEQISDELNEHCAFWHSLGGEMQT